MYKTPRRANTPFITLSAPSYFLCSSYEGHVTGKVLYHPFLCKCQASLLDWLVGWWLAGDEVRFEEEGSKGGWIRVGSAVGRL